LLGDPGARRVRRDSGEVYSAGVELDEEQDVEAAEQHGVDGEEVRGEYRGGLGPDELAPRRTLPDWAGVESGSMEDPANCGRRDGDAEASEFTVDALVAPSWVLAGETHDQVADL
jgi:hypothetical protein